MTEASSSFSGELSVALHEADAQAWDNYLDDYSVLAGVSKIDGQNVFRSLWLLGTFQKNPLLFVYHHSSTSPPRYQLNCIKRIGDLTNFTPRPSGKRVFLTFFARDPRKANEVVELSGVQPDCPIPGLPHFLPSVKDAYHTIVAMRKHSPGFSGSSGSLVRNIRGKENPLGKVEKGGLKDSLALFNLSDSQPPHPSPVSSKSPAQSQSMDRFNLSDAQPPHGSATAKSPKEGRVGGGILSAVNREPAKLGGHSVGKENREREEKRPSPAAKRKPSPFTQRRQSPRARPASSQTKDPRKFLQQMGQKYEEKEVTKEEPPPPRKAYDPRKNLMFQGALSSSSVSGRSTFQSSASHTYEPGSKKRKLGMALDPVRRSPSPMEIGKTGFTNLGNTCYLNAIVQGLLSMEEFTGALKAFYDQLDQWGIAPKPAALFKGPEDKAPDDKAPNDKAPDDNKEKPSLLRAIVRLEDSRNNRKTQSSGTSMVRGFLKVLKEAISTKANRFSGYDQHDAYELLGQIVEQLKEEIDDLLLNAANFTEEEDATKSRLMEVDNPMRTLFEFEIVSVITCGRCKTRVEKGEVANDLTLDLPIVKMEDGMFSLQDLLNLTFLSEDVEYRCEVCQHKSAHLVRSFRRLPQILAVCVKRYVFNWEDGVGQKMDDDLDLQPYLTLSSHCYNPPSTSNSHEDASRLAQAFEEEQQRMEEGPDPKSTVAKKEEAIQEPKEEDVEPSPALNSDKKEAGEPEPTKVSSGDGEGEEANWLESGSNEAQSAPSSLGDEEGGKEREKTPETLPPSEIPETPEKAMAVEGEEAGRSGGVRKSSRVADAAARREVEEQARLLEEARRAAEEEAERKLAEARRLEREAFAGARIKRLLQDPFRLQIKENEKDGQLQDSYRLSCVVSHLGYSTKKNTLKSGHYVSECREGEDWWTLDDEKVSKTTFPDLAKKRRQDGYIFLFNKISAPH